MYILTSFSTSADLYNRGNFNLKFMHCKYMSSLTADTYRYTVNVFSGLTDDTYTDYKCMSGLTAYTYTVNVCPG